MAIVNKPVLWKGSPLKAGQPVSTRGLADTIRALVLALESLDVRGGKIEWKDGRPLIIMDE